MVCFRSIRVARDRFATHKARYIFCVSGSTSIDVYTNLNGRFDGRKYTFMEDSIEVGGGRFTSIEIHGRW